MCLYVFLSCFLVDSILFDFFPLFTPEYYDSFCNIFFFFLYFLFAVMEKKTFLVAYKNVACYHFTSVLFLVICYVLLNINLFFLFFFLLLSLSNVGGLGNGEMENTPFNFCLFYRKRSATYSFLLMERSWMNFNAHGMKSFRFSLF